MQPAQTQLEEIVWEICGQCNNHCSYCGSKEVWNEPINENKIREIADKIALYPPKVINISGGDTTLVSYETHKYVVDLLKSKGVKCHILVHPKSYDNQGKELYRLYDHIGLSINNSQELELARKYFADINWRKLTIITNFNLSNVFEFDTICGVIQGMQSQPAWQIQYTVYKGKSNNMALYKSKKAVDYLASSVKKAIDEGVKILISDNMNTCPCSAGKYTLGITYDGNILPCLSMRSWVKDITSVSQGNLLLLDKELVYDEEARDAYDIDPLEYIWINRFFDYRFKSFKCCKDVTKVPIAEYVRKEKVSIAPATIPATIPNIPIPVRKDPYPTQPRQPIIVYYGVWPQAPQDWYPKITAYAVSPGSGTTWSITTNTLTDDDIVSVDSDDKETL